ncbi:hypothetical protein ASC78_21775 [Variovorax sp. Root318D1]|nr:hypothetical protein ASC78_21775 [Variovorax sp. Root318D1]
MELAQLESVLGASLPRSFKQYLQVANGGYLEYVVEIATESGETEPISFCGLFSTTSSGGEIFADEIALHRESMQMPIGILPFACDGGGSTAFLDLTPTGSGRVVAYVHGLPEWAGKRTQSALVELASSFDEYVAKLKVDREAIVDHLSHDVANMNDLSAMREFIELAIPEWLQDPELSNAVREAQQMFNRS